MTRAKGARPDAEAMTRAIHGFLCSYAPRFLTSSENTLKAYRDALTLYFEFLQSRGVTVGTLRYAHLERGWIEDWMAWLGDERGNSPQTVNNRLASLRRFLEYLAHEDVALSHLWVGAKEVKRLTAPKRHVRGMSREAVEALLAAPDTSTAIGRRDLTFMTVAYATGARCGELATLTYGQLRLGAPKPSVSYVGKGNKARTIYLLARPAAMLRKYVSEALGPNPGAGDLLFPSRVNGGPMTVEAWDGRIRKYARIAHETCPEVPVDAHSHLFRHAAATGWINDGLSLYEVQLLLGHESPETTMQYIDVDKSSLAKGLSALEGKDGAGVEKKWHKPGAESLVDHLGLGKRRS